MRATLYFIPVEGNLTEWLKERGFTEGSSAPDCTWGGLWGRDGLFEPSESEHQLVSLSRPEWVGKWADAGELVGMTAGVSTLEGRVGGAATASLGHQAAAVVTMSSVQLDGAGGRTQQVLVGCVAGTKREGYDMALGEQGLERQNCLACTTAETLGMQTRVHLANRRASAEEELAHLPPLPETGRVLRLHVLVNELLHDLLTREPAHPADVRVNAAAPTPELRRHVQVSMFVCDGRVVRVYIVPVSYTHLTLPTIYSV